jgi:feruloyl esterase
MIRSVLPQFLRNRPYLPKLFAFLVPAAGVAWAETPCEQLKSIQLANTTITAVESVRAGTYKPAGMLPGPGGQQPDLHVPAFCRVAATLRPSADSDIKVEFWLPDEWNGKYQAVGNGGWAGSITYPAMAAALAEGYAASSTDTGHVGGDASFAPGHPEKLIDYSYRAVHEMAVKAKAIITARYGRAPRYSYWNGCSYGGRQGLEEAQRYPEDFDGIIAGAPANYHVHLHAFDVNAALTNLKDEAHLVPPEKLAVLNKAVLAACDALDGVKDGLLNDPRKCKFDPETVRCKGAGTSNCLTGAQLESVKAMYAPAKKRNGEIVYPGMPFGGELGWTRMNASEPLSVAVGTFRYVLYEDPNWDWRKFDLDRDVAAVEEKAPYLNAINPDLKAFRDRGGKLLMYHGWNDQLITAENSINYYSSVANKLGGNLDNWYRLFMAPGMQHCRGGPGPNQFNLVAVMERWREQGEVPAQIPAYHVTNNNVDMARPLCPYPQVAVYKGSGSTNDAANFTCAVP